MARVTTPGRKINLMILVTGLGIGGAEVVIQRLAETIDRRMFNLTICCINGRGPIGDELARNGIDVIALFGPNRRQTSYLAFVKLWLLARRKRVDIVHTHTTSALLDAAVCKLLQARFKLVHTFHFGNYPHRPRKQLWFERFGSKFADRLVAVGDQQQRQLKATFGFTEARIGRVWNGVAFLKGSSGNSFREQIGGTNRVVIGTIATLIEQKGLFDFLTVARRIRDRHEDVRFVVIGDGRLRAQLEAARRDLGLEDTVVFTGWLPDAAQVALPAMDVFFQPSLWEAMSIALLEAMAAGKGIVATRVGDAPYMVRDGVDGFLVEPRDVDGMVVALERLIDDPELRQRLGRSAAEVATQQFSIERMTRAYEDLYLAMT